jgi:hypothetical protein
MTYEIKNLSIAFNNDGLLLASTDAAGQVTLQGLFNYLRQLSPPPI